MPACPQGPPGRPDVWLPQGDHRRAEGGTVGAMPKRKVSKGGRPLGLWPFTLLVCVCVCLCVSVCVWMCAPGVLIVSGPACHARLDHAQPRVRAIPLPPTLATSQPTISLPGRTPGALCAPLVLCRPPSAPAAAHVATVHPDPACVLCRLCPPPCPPPPNCCAPSLSPSRLRSQDDHLPRPPRPSHLHRGPVKGHHGAGAEAPREPPL